MLTLFPVQGQPLRYSSRYVSVYYYCTVVCVYSYVAIDNRYSSEELLLETLKKQHHLLPVIERVYITLKTSLDICICAQTPFRPKGLSGMPCSPLSSCNAHHEKVCESIKISLV